MTRFTGKTAILAVFILCALPVGIFITLITPPGQSPDEPAHLARAAGLLHWAVIGERHTIVDPDDGKPQEISGVTADSGIMTYDFSPITHVGNRPVVTSDIFLHERATPSDHHLAFNGIPNTVTYFPAAYIPAAFGLGIGLALHEPPYICFTLARLAMLTAFLVLAVLAIQWTAYGEALLTAILLLPMTLFLAGTLNQDGILIPIVCLACALLTRRSHAAKLTGLALLTLFLCSKPPYLPILAVTLLPLASPGITARLRNVIIACIPLFIWVALDIAFVVVPFGQPPHHPGPLFTGNPNMLVDHTDAAANLHILLAKPSRLITLPWITAKIWFMQSLREMVGVLGPLQLVFPEGYYRLWWSSLAIAAAGLLVSRREETATPLNNLLNLLAIALLLPAMYWLIQLSFYLNWSSVGDASISGFQGRYLLPLLPLLLFGIPGQCFRLRLPIIVPALPALALGLFDLGYIPMKLVWNYYLH